MAAVAYLRGIDNEGNSVKVATNNVTEYAREEFTFE